MIRVYSANYTAQDYRNIADILRVGMRMVCPNFGITANKDIPCSDCDCFKGCLACGKASDYCQKKAAEMVEP